MVRLVFRPYTQIRRSICTLESLRASTRVSPGFTLHRHSSPSFGSQQICSHSNLSSMTHDRSMVRVLTPSHRVTFISHRGFATRVLAYTLDSLVRVSRRVGEVHFVSIWGCPLCASVAAAAQAPGIAARHPPKQSRWSSLEPNSGVANRC